jgi:hypothetical protein
MGKSFPGAESILLRAGEGLLARSSVALCNCAPKHTNSKVVSRNSVQESTQKQLQGRRRGVPRNIRRPCVFERRLWNNRVGSRSGRRRDREVPRPALFFWKWCYRNCAAGLARIRNRSRRFFRLVHSYVCAFRFCLRSCALTRLRMHCGTSGNRQTPQAC